MSHLFSYNYLTTHYSMVKCCRNVKFEEIDTEHSTGKNDRFWLLWGTLKEYTKQNVIMAVLRKAFHSDDTCRLITDA